MIPIPRRLVLLALVVGSSVVFLHTFAPTVLPPVLTPHLPHHEPDASVFSGAKWLPPILNPEYLGDLPPEYDDDGACLFLSPFAALSAAEKKRAEGLVFDEVSPGIVRARPPQHPILPPSPEGVPIATEALQDDEFELVNVTKTTTESQGLTHPILGLLREGEVKWNDMIGRQSQTLAQAVAVYKERWGRNPPKGFDAWWNFARVHTCFLPDEFDAIMDALLPYYGLPIKTMQERVKEAQKVVETFTIIVHEGKVELQWNDDYSRDFWSPSRSRAESQINLMEPFLRHVGSFHATFSIHDQPSILLDYKRKEELVTAARRKAVLDKPNEDDRHQMDWSKACAPDSAINRQVTEAPETDTFVQSHLQSMDVCEHPSLLENHGMFLEVHDKDVKPQPHTRLLPIFVQSKTALNGDIPATPIGRDGRRDDVGHDVPWKKKDSRLYWRGVATGMSHNKAGGSKWRQSHRERLHFLTNDHSDNFTEVLAPVGTTGEAQLTSLPIKQLGQYYTDTKLEGGAWQCDWDDGTCAEMDEEITFVGKDAADRGNEYKFIFDTDGNAWSSRFPRLMSSTSMIVKATVFPEWNSHILPEWYAYVPVKMDYSDLFSVLSFFRGTPSGRGAHDEVARRIALNGQCWVEKTWRREDLQIYMFRLYIEYARLVSSDRDNGKMDFVMPGT